MLKPASDFLCSNLKFNQCCCTAAALRGWGGVGGGGVGGGASNQSQWPNLLWQDKEAGQIPDSTDVFMDELSA